MDASLMVRGHDLFRSLPPREIDTVSSLSVVKRFDKGEVIHHRGHPASHLFVLLKGRVEQHLGTSAGEVGLVVGHAESGDLFGVASLLGAERYTTTARCAEPCEVMALEAVPLQEVLRRNPEADRAILASVARGYFTRYEALLGRLQAILAQVTGG
jgi:CRP-like cAMP-binding protein